MVGRVVRWVLAVSGLGTVALVALVAPLEVLAAVGGTAAFVLALLIDPEEL